MTSAQAPIPLAAALLEYALSHARLPSDQSVEALELAERWFSLSPPLIWRAALLYYEKGQFEKQRPGFIAC